MDSTPIQQLDKTPQHVAFAMDGNLRWAKKNGLSSEDGLKQGIETMKAVVRRAKQYGIPTVTFWALSTENWRKRGETFTNIIMRLMRQNLDDMMLFDEVLQEGGEMHIIGDTSAFPEDIQNKLSERLTEKPEKKHIDVNIALNYGGRQEILHAVRQVMKNDLRPEEITPELFSQYMYTVNHPDPDLIIRTGMHQRLSGFMMWQSEYAELYFPALLWPEFTNEAFDEALRFYGNEDRNFGGVSQGFADYANESN